MEGLGARLQRRTNKHTSLLEYSMCDVTGKGLCVRGLDHASAVSTRSHEPSHATHIPKEDSGTFCKSRCRS